MVGALKVSDPVLLGPQLVVAGFSTHVEIARAHEIANEARRVKKQLKDCQQLAMLYNNRERIFGLPVTNVGLLRACCPPKLHGLRKSPWHSWPYLNPAPSQQGPGIWRVGLSSLQR